MKELSLNQLTNIIGFACGSLQTNKCERIASLLYASGIRFIGDSTDLSLSYSFEENNIRKNSLTKISNFLEFI